MLLYIVRHGHPDYATDTLTDTGKMQAELVGKRLFDEGIDVIYSSPMGRAIETAEPACEMMGIRKHIEEWAHEIGDERLTTFPDGKLKPIGILQNTHFLEDGNFAYSYDDTFKCPPLKSANMQAAVEYIEENGKNFLERLGYKEENGSYRILRENNQKVALFCHAAFLKTWLSVLLKVPLHVMWSSFEHSPFTAVTVIEFKNNPDGFTAPRCIKISDVSHLPDELVGILHTQFNPKPEQE